MTKLKDLGNGRPL